MTYLELYELSGKVGEVHFNPYSFTYSGESEIVLDKLEEGPYAVDVPVDAPEDVEQPVFYEDTRMSEILTKHERLLDRHPITEIQRIDE
jgi:hypothetical protein